MSPAEKFSPDAKQQLTPKQFIDRARAEHEMNMQKFLALFSSCALSGTTAVALGLFFLQGFHAWGFQLDNSLMHWIGAATIGSIASLAATVYGAFFKKS